MTASKKIKTTDNQIEQNKAQYYLEKQSPNISPSSSENVSKYEF